MSDTTELYVVNVKGPNDKGWYSVQGSDEKRYDTKIEKLISVAKQAKDSGRKVLIGSTTTQNGQYTNYRLDAIELLPDKEEAQDTGGKKIALTPENVRLQAMGHALKIIELRALEPTAANILAISAWAEKWAWHGNDGVVAQPAQQAIEQITETVASSTPPIDDGIPF